MYKNFANLAEAFLTYFDVDVVTTERQLEQARRIRYKVYCEEFGYEPADQFPNRQESDEFDAYSLHCLITHKRSKRAAGCSRLVCASDSHRLPLEKYCLDNVFVDYAETLTEDRDNLCEMSRLAVDVAFRKRIGEKHTRLGEYDALDCSHQEQRTFSLVGFATFLSAFALASLAGRHNVFGMMESNLPRLMHRGGILVQQAGNFAEYHGERAPYFITSDMVVDNIREDLRVLYDALHDSLAVNFDAVRNVA